MAPVDATADLVATADPRVRNLGPFLNASNLLQYRPLEVGPWATPLLRIGTQPVVVAGEVDERQVAIVAFDARYPNTDLVLQPAWPILIAELSAWFSPPRALDLTGSLQPGATVPIRLIEDANAAVVTRPDGERVELTPDGSSAVFAGTDAPGLYSVDLLRGDEGSAPSNSSSTCSTVGERSRRETASPSARRPSHRARGKRRPGEFWPIAAIGWQSAGQWLVYHRSLRRLPRVACRRAAAHP